MKTGVLQTAYAEILNRLGIKLFDYRANEDDTKVRISAFRAMFRSRLKTAIQSLASIVGSYEYPDRDRFINTGVDAFDHSGYDGPVQIFAALASATAIAVLVNWSRWSLPIDLGLLGVSLLLAVPLGLTAWAYQLERRVPEIGTWYQSFRLGMSGTTDDLIRRLSVPERFRETIERIASEIPDAYFQLEYLNETILLARTKELKRTLMLQDTRDLVALSKGREGTSFVIAVW
ncbi:MAG: hypothetical protein KGI79_02850 [Patescibacteria group bacterium]|nr:hypothetical protein [Patescibacteria group bacterium]MDE2116789.1 hypothetical protein [Patescibacteria group bacterium]